MNTTDQAGTIGLTMQTMIAAQDRRPYVTLAISGRDGDPGARIVLSADEAKAAALNLLAAAETAGQDAALLAWLMGTLGMTAAAAGAAITGYRQARLGLQIQADPHG